MSRLTRKNRTDVVYKREGGISDAFDDAMKELWRINDKEYNYIVKNATDAELDMILDCSVTDWTITYRHKRSEMKTVLSIIDKYIEDLNAEASKKRNY